MEEKDESEEEGRGEGKMKDWIRQEKNGVAKGIYEELWEIGKREIKEEKRKNFFETIFHSENGVMSFIV